MLGYDLLNEPWPGPAFATCRNTAGCPTFDRTRLAPFYRRVIGAIRSTDRKHIVFYEPHVLYNFGAETNLPDLGKHLGFSFHDYCFLGLVAGSPAHLSRRWRARSSTTPTPARRRPATR